MATAQEFREALSNRLRRAELAKSAFLEVNAGDLHTEVGDYPDPKKHRMKTCCDVMEAAMQPGDRITAAPPKGKGASLTIQYKLPRR